MLVVRGSRGRIDISEPKLLDSLVQFYKNHYEKLMVHTSTSVFQNNINEIDSYLNTGIETFFIKHIGIQYLKFLKIFIEMLFPYNPEIEYSQVVTKELKNDCDNDFKKPATFNLHNYNDNIKAFITNIKNSNSTGLPDVLVEHFANIIVAKKKDKDNYCRVLKYMLSIIDKYEMKVDETLVLDNLTQILNYQAKIIVTSFETNIKQNYANYVERFINILFDKKSVLEKIKLRKDIDKEEMKKERQKFLKMLRQYTKAVYKQQVYKLPENLVLHYSKIMVQRELEINLKYDVKKHSQDYLSCMIYMMKYIEAKNEKISKVFPLITTLIPGYFRIDTTTLIYLFMKDDEKVSINTVNKSKDYVWSEIFNMDNKCFRKKNYFFDHQITTDGIACSILFSAKNGQDKKRKCMFDRPKKEKNITTDTNAEEEGNLKEETTGLYKKNEPNEYYLDELSSEKKASLLNKVVVGIDPGKSDLIYCSGQVNGKIEHFRYTQCQRKYESKIKIYTEMRIKSKKKSKVGKKTVEQIETELSQYKSKTLDFNKYCEYVKKKNETNKLLNKYYTQEIFRKRKWQTKINRDRSERKMINNFEKKFGKPENVVLAYGDFGQKHQMKFKEPTLGKGMRDLFRRYGYRDLYLIDEFCTSKKCNECEENYIFEENEEIGNCEKFLLINNPKFRYGKKERKSGERAETLCHGLMRCQTCERYWNRDVNASRNMMRLGTSAIKGGETRPKYFSRKKKDKGCKEAKEEEEEEDEEEEDEDEEDDYKE